MPATHGNPDTPQNDLNLERHLVDREAYKTRRSAALAEWQNLMA
jgi:putative transposase